MAGQGGFFDAEERLRWLSASGDPLERLRAVVEFEAFRAELEAALPRADRSRGGRPPYDAVLMFRILVLQALYTLSDEQAEYQLRDRLSFMRFAGLALHEAAAQKALNVLLLDGSRAETAAQPTPEFARMPRNERVRRAALIMEQNLCHPLPVSEIARRINVSARQLERLFRSDLGAAPADVYRDMRVAYGKWLLAATDRSIAEIALLTGFVDGAHFSRVFKSVAGATPSVFRARATPQRPPGAEDELPRYRRVWKP